MDIEIPDGLIPFIIVCLVAAWWAWGMLQLLVVNPLRDHRRYRRLRRRHGKAAARTMMARARKARGDEADDTSWDYNPATGLPMDGPIFDIAGNPYGLVRDDED